MDAYKLLTLRKDGTLGPLFIGRRLVLPLGVPLQAQDIPTPGYAHRPGWHCLARPFAPHLALRPNRVWASVSIEDFTCHLRPESQGGLWYLAQVMTITDIVET